jgi:hypothetical protein
MQEQKQEIENNDWTVTKNSDNLYKSSVVWESDTDVKEILPYEKEMLKGTKSIKEFMNDEENETEIFKTDEEIREEEIKHILSMIRVLSLYDMNKYVLMDITTLDKPERQTYEEHRIKYKKEYDEDVDIKDKFHKVCNEKLFYKGVDISKYKFS